MDPALIEYGLPFMGIVALSAAVKNLFDKLITALIDRVEDQKTHTQEIIKVLGTVETAIDLLKASEPLRKEI